MASPTAPTLTAITTEALRKAGMKSPTSDQLTRAATWMEEVKRDISRRERRLKSLYVTAYAVCTIGKSRYSLPTDYFSDLAITILDGTRTGTAQDGSVSSITLAADESITDDELIGRFIFATSGTGALSYSQCTSYSETTKVAGVTPDFTTAVANGTGYMITDDTFPLGPPVYISKIDAMNATTSKDTPVMFAFTGNSTTGEFALWPVPDIAYGIQLRYYLNLMTLDLAGTLIGTLYRNFYDVWVQGVYARQLQSNDDIRAQTEMQLYFNLLDLSVMDEVDRDNEYDDYFIKGAF
jgi:hypothetical protein